MSNGNIVVCVSQQNVFVYLQNQIPCVLGLKKKHTHTHGRIESNRMFRRLGSCLLRFCDD